MGIIFYAIPGFLCLIAIELLVERARGTAYYRLNDTLTSLMAGTLSQLVGLLKKLVPFTIYVYVYANFALFEQPDSVLIWFICFILYDLCYYWLHRAGHEVNLFWAAHVVHHSSEDYNLATALRQTSGSFFSTVFYLPMAILGFDPLMVLTVGALNLVYQFWVHTQHLPKLGWFEWLFITPSNHRVHHAQNDLYMDRNYGGVFILWDRLFGSFQEELDEHPPIYGIRGAIRSWNPIWVNLHVYHQLWQDCLHTRQWRHKFSLWFHKTGWRPPDVVEAYPLVKPELSSFQKFETPMSLGLKLYSLFQYSVITVLALIFLLYSQTLSSAGQLGYVAFLMVSAGSLGSYIQGKSIFMWSELFKNLALIVAFLTIQLPFAVSSGVLFAISVLVILSLTLLFYLKRENINRTNLPFPMPSAE